MRVIFLGTPEFAVPSLDALVGEGINVCSVVTQPDRPRGRSHSTLLPSPVKECALRHGIPVLQPDRPTGEEFLSAVRAADADLGVVVAYGHLLRPALLDIPRLGMVNVHASLLPRWRGAAPIHWAIASGDAHTGVSIMRVEQGLDTGAVWRTASAPIGEHDTTGTLFTRLAALGADTLVNALPDIERGELPTPQSTDGVTHAPKVDRETARIDWNADAASVARLIRAMDPAPGAWTTANGETVKLYGATVVESPVPLAPGAVHTHYDTMMVGAGTGAVAIEEAQPSGRRRMSAGDWLRGDIARAGASFT